ncbi:MAG: hypothetical protein HYX25_08470 [Candidatus Solibacter usitatus]|nr:hypothetical protein [Candidatus Solibacter usitatus]
MSHLEDELKSALGRKETAEDFTQRVLQRIAGPAPRSWFDELATLLRPPRLQWVAASLVILVVPFAALEYRRERQVRAQGEVAKQQLMLAMRIAGAELYHAQQQVQRISRMENQ